MQRLTCSRCGDEDSFSDDCFEDGEFELFGWAKIDDELYCERCYEYDDFGNQIAKG